MRNSCIPDRERLSDEDSCLCVHPSNRSTGLQFCHASPAWCLNQKPPVRNNYAVRFGGLMALRETSRRRVGVRAVERQATQETPLKVQDLKLGSLVHD